MDHLTYVTSPSGLKTLQVSLQQIHPPYPNLKNFIKTYSSTDPLSTQLLFIFICFCRVSTFLTQHIMTQYPTPVHQAFLWTLCACYVAQKIRPTSACLSTACPLFKFNQFQFKIKKHDSLLEKGGFFFHYINLHEIMYIPT